MPGKIFISYRREDAAGDARGVRDALTARFGRSNVFMDIDDLLAGQRFDKELSRALDDCEVLVAVIGPRWMDLLKMRMQGGDLDYVRSEISAALQRGIVIIPTRVGLAGRMVPLPRPDDLPDDIRDLVLHQKHDVAHESFGRDVADLIVAIDSARERLQRDDLTGSPPVGSQGPKREDPGPSHKEAHRQQGHASNGNDAKKFATNRTWPHPSRWLSFAVAFVLALGVGGTLVYSYRSLVGSHPGRAPEGEANLNAGVRATPRDRESEVAYNEGTPPVAGRTSVSPEPQTRSYAVVLSSHKTYRDAVKVMADLQQQFPAILGNQAFDVHELDMSARGLGTMYRLVVGPRESHFVAHSVCNRLKAAGYVSCWIKEY